MWQSLDCKNMLCFTKNSLWTHIFLLPFQYYSQYIFLNALGSREHINFLARIVHTQLLTQRAHFRRGKRTHKNHPVCPSNTRLRRGLVLEAGLSYKTSTAQQSDPYFHKTKILKGNTPL